MKKIIFGVLVVFASILLVGCGKEEVKKVEEKVTGGWATTITTVKASIPDDAKEAFDKAVKDKTSKYEAVALLAKQVVAGTNYMFLATVDNNTYKIVTIYNDLEDKATIKNENDFDVTKYVSKDIELKQENLMGGWKVMVTSEGVKLEDKVNKVFEDAISKNVGTTYLPIANMATQVVAGTNYAVLCYGRLATQNEETGVFLLTIYNDLQGNSSLTSSAYIDLTEYNK